MPEVSASIEIDSSPESIWRVLMDLEGWPAWSPLFQMVRLHDPSSGTAGGFTIHGLVGRVPYNAEFMVFDYEPLRHFIFQAVNPSPPYNTLWHDVRLTGHTLSWTTVYAISGGPGGQIVDRLMIRRAARRLVQEQLAAVAGRVTSANGVG